MGMCRYNRRSRRIRDVREAGPTFLGLALRSVVYCFLLPLFAWGGGLCPDFLMQAKSRAVNEPSYEGGCCSVSREWCSEHMSAAEIVRSCTTYGS